MSKDTNNVIADEYLRLAYHGLELKTKALMNFNYFRGEFTQDKRIPQDVEECCHLFTIRLSSLVTCGVQGL
jgi:hypothetical protein